MLSMSATDQMEMCAVINATSRQVDFGLNQTMKKKPNEPMHLIPVPAALMSHFLLAQEMRHKQAGIGDGGR